MLEIQRSNGITQSFAYCDKCGNGYQWDGIVSLTQLEKILRSKKGWRVGKKHICESCKAK